jgi:hypothetical protein
VLQVNFQSVFGVLQELFDVFVIIFMYFGQKMSKCNKIAQKMSSYGKVWP